MKNKTYFQYLILILGLLLSRNLASSHRHTLCQGFLPENDLHIPVTQSQRGGISQQSFNTALDRVEEVMSSYVAEHGGRLQVQRAWEDGTVNAYAERQGQTFLIKMFGGLARHQTMTRDGFTLVACHEIGHHIGGVPRYSGRWASSEGQSDYYGTLKCLRLVWAQDNNQEIMASRSVDPTAKSKCDQSFNNAEDKAICQRAAMAGKAGAKLFAALGGGAVPQFGTPDTTQVSQHMESHPPAQCRLDTYFQGALCPVPPQEGIGQNSPNPGTCNRDNGDEEGLRPRCWFAYRGGGNPDPGPDPGPSPNPGQAPGPLLNGGRTLTLNNPQQPVAIKIDVTSIRGAKGVLMEISKPNRDFQNPGGRKPDPVGGLGYEAFRGPQGTYRLVPGRQLPGWGRYKIRVMALDEKGRPVGRFSPSAVLELRPR